MRRRIAMISTVALVVAGTAGCGSDAELEGLTVTGDFGSEPTVKVDGFDVEASESQELIEGDGPEIGKDSYVMYHGLIVKGADGEILQNSYEQPETQEMVVDEQPELISDAVVGTNIGSRVAVAAPIEELVGKGGAGQVGLTAEDDVIFVFDLIEEGEPPLSGPKGEKLDPPADAPKVVEKEGTVTGLDFSDAPAKPPAKFQAIPLIEGDGPAVKEGDTITVDYLGTKWGGEDQPFDNSFERGEPAEFPLTRGGLIDGWLKGLDGAAVGSRLLLVIPPELGYGAKGNPEIDVTGKDTLVFLIDILATDG